MEFNGKSVLEYSDFFTWQAHLQLSISLQTTSTVYNVHQVDGGPGKWHTVPAETLAELLRLATKLLQLLFILKLTKKKT